MPFGGGLGSTATGTLTHQLVVGHDSDKVALAGLAPVALGGLLDGAAILAARNEKYDTATVLLGVGGGVALFGPTITTGLMSAHQAGRDEPVASGLRVDSVSVTPVEGGARVGIGGRF